VPVIPHPIVPVPVPVPHPIVPEPIPPKPVDPAPAPAPQPKPVEPGPPAPKPQDPARPTIDDPNQLCKKAGISGSGCDVPIKPEDIDKFRTKGVNVIADVRNAQRVATPQDVNRPFVGADYTYEFRANEKTPLDAEDVKFLEHDKVQFSTGLDWSHSTIRNPLTVNNKLEASILETYENINSRAIVIRDSKKDNDMKLPENERARWSDMTMHNWLQACSHNPAIPPDSLQYILRENIMAGSSASRTRELIDNALQKAGMNPAEVNTFRSGVVPGPLPAEITGFEILSGSDHVNRVHRMLADYPATMQNVRIESLTVTTIHTDSAENAYNILIKLTKVATP
jgi:hypothetical protein